MTLAHKLCKFMIPGFARLTLIPPESEILCIKFLDNYNASYKRVQLTELSASMSRVRI